MADITRGSVLIAAPADRVATVIADLPSYPQWTDGMSNIQVLESRDGQPVRASFSVSGGPISDTVELAYSWTSSSLTWTLLKGSTITAMNGSYSWQSVDGGTEVTYELEIGLSIGLPGFIKRTAEKTIVSTALQGLKKRVEGLS